MTADLNHLPPGPFGYMMTAAPGEHEGRRHVYLTDRDDRKIACIWGKQDEKLALVSLIIDALPPQVQGTENVLKPGDRIRIFTRFGTEDHTLEEFRHCLGFFMSHAHRTAGCFSPLCEWYEPGPDSVEIYIPNFGPYRTNQVQAWGEIPAHDDADGS